MSAVSHDPCDLTIQEAARLLRRGELSAVELVSSVLQRIAATESRVHAYVLVFEDGARAAAEAADKVLREGRDLGPLHGIPVAIKDIVDV
ncbi:MAG: Asp-tRNA(Asn)/Glu-tRNA(Gln) amidotransferase GatCAB subunit A, partial [Chloroflexota bacterium]